MCLVAPKIQLEFWSSVRRKERHKAERTISQSKMRLFIAFLVVLGSVASPLKLPDSLKPNTTSKPTSITKRADANTNVTLTFTVWAAIFSEIKELQVFYNFKLDILWKNCV